MTRTLIAAAVVLGLSAASSAALTMNVAEQAAFDRINEEREANALDPFTFDPGLFAAGKAHGEDMARFDTVGGIITTDEGEFSVLDRIAGVVPSSVGFAAGTAGSSSDDGAFVAGLWLDSSGNRASLTNSLFTRAAVALVQDPEPDVFSRLWTYALATEPSTTLPADPPGAGAGTGAPGEGVSFDPGDGSEGEQMAALINQLRAANALGAVALDAKLSTAAQAHSADIAARGATVHVGADGSTFTDRIAASGFDGRAVGETVASARSAAFDAESVFSLWRNSTPHRSILLNPNANRLGVGVAGSSSGTFWTAKFGAANVAVIPLPASGWFLLSAVAAMCVSARRGRRGRLQTVGGS